MMNHMEYSLGRPSPGVTISSEYSVIESALGSSFITDITGVDDLWEISYTFGFELIIDADFRLVTARSPRVLEPEEIGLIILRLRVLGVTTMLRERCRDLWRNRCGDETTSKSATR